MSNFAIIFSTGTTNILPNPSLELSAIGYLGIQSTIARTSVQQSRGVYSLSVVVTGTASNIGVVFTGTTLTANSVYSYSVDVYATAGDILKACFIDSSNVVLASQILTGTGFWQRVNVSWTETGTATRRVGLFTNGNLNTHTFYADGWQLENGPNTTYCDGDTDDCYWNGGSHSSTSTRPNSSYLGGIEKDFETDLGFKIVLQNGIGQVPVSNLSAELSIQPGAFYLGAGINQRVLNFVGIFKGTSPKNLHTVRNNLIKLLQPGNKYVLKYKLPDKALLIRVVYDSGLEFGRPSGNIEKSPLRFIAFDPFWYEEFQQGSTLTPLLNVASANNVIQKNPNGTWHSLSNGLTWATNNNVYAFARGLDNTLYLGGTWNGIPGYANSAGFGYYQNNSLIGVASGVSGSALSKYVYDMCLCPNGKIAVVGSFAAIGGVAKTRSVALFNPTTLSFESITPTSAANNNLFSCCINADGNLIVGGNATIDGTATNGVGLYEFSTSTWSNVGNAGFASGTVVQNIVLAPDGSLYASANTPIVKQWSNNTWTTLSIFPYNVPKMVFDPSGEMYFADAVGFKRYNGNIIETLGTLSSPSIPQTIVYNPKKGSFSFGGTGLILAPLPRLPDNVAQWNGASFAYIDADLPGSAKNVYALNVATDGTLTIGFDTTGTATASAITTLSNRSTAPAYPVIQFSVSGTASAVTLYQIANEDTGETIYFNLAIQPGEAVTLDLRPNKKTLTSTFRGNIYSTILKGSNLGTFALTTSNPNISMFASSAALAVNIYWYVTHYSGDGSS